MTLQQFEFLNKDKKEAAKEIFSSCLNIFNSSIDVNILLAP